MSERSVGRVHDDARGETLALTVVIPVLNESAGISSLLEQLSAQIEPPGGFEVLVADGGSSDGTQEICRQFSQRDPRVRLISNPRRLSSAGRNVGIREARGGYVVFVDGHCEVPRRDYLVRCHEIFESEGVDCLCRPQSLRELASTDWERAIATARHSWLGHNPRSSIYGGVVGYCDPKPSGASYSRRCLISLGGFDERFDACEDVELNARLESAGYLAYWHSDLAIHYRPRSSLSALLRQMFRYGRGRGRLLLRHPWVLPWPLVLAAVVAALLLALALQGAWSTLLWLSAGSVLVWLATVLIESGRVTWRSGYFWRVVACFSTIHSGLLAGFVRGILDLSRIRRTKAPGWVD